MIPDTLSKKSVALPAAAATATTATIDLGAAPGPVPALQVELVVPTLTALVSTKLLTLKLLHSSDDSTFVEVPTTGTMVITGISGNGAAAKTFRLYLPPDVNRYLRASATVESGGGDNTAKTLTLQLAA